MNITIDGRQVYLQEIIKDMHINVGDVSLITEASPSAPVQKADTFTKTSESLTEKDLSDDVSTIEDSLDFKISEGMTREQLATHFGDLGRKLDDEYAAGKYTEEEYNDLNEQLMEYYGSAITRCEQRAASERVKKAGSMENNLKPLVVKTYKNRSMTNIEKILNGMGVEVNLNKVGEYHYFDLSELKKVIKDLTNELKSGLSGDQNGEEMTDEQHETDAKEGIPALERNIDKYAAKYCATDRGAMAVIMDAVRQGGELLGGRDEHYGQD